MERCRTLVDMFERSCEDHEDRPALGTRGSEGWGWLSYGALRRRVDLFRSGLESLGLRQGEQLAIVSNNSVEWAIAAYAAYGLGAVVVPLYEKQRPAEWEFILRDAGASVAIAGTSAIASKLVELRGLLPELRHVVDVSGAAVGASPFQAVLARGERASVAALQPAEDSTAALIYTSGTTGKPKGVILSHGNIASNINAGRELFGFTEEDRTLSFIPWAHAFGHTCELHTVLSLGASIGINDQLSRLAANLVEVKPTILVAVPRVFNGLFSRIHASLAERPSAVRRLFDAAVDGKKREHRGERPTVAQRLAALLADPIIFAKVRESLGGRLKYAISGGAALAPEVAELIEAIGIAVYEGYGLTETSPLVSANRPGHVRLGSVGRPIPGVTVRIDRKGPDGPDGEIVVFGPNVTKGYHHRPEEQATSFTNDGGFRTGDLGFLDADGFLHVTGRIKEQYKLENGRYVVPAPLEEQLQLSPYIASAVLHGANRPHCVVLVALNMEAVAKWARKRGFTLADPARDPHVRTLIAEELAARSAEFKEYEKPRGFLLTTEEFTPENELLTASLKLKRPAVMARYGSALEALYAARSAA